MDGTDVATYKLYVFLRAFKEKNLIFPMPVISTAWMGIHQDELMANWKLAVNGQPTFKIEALK